MRAKILLWKSAAVLLAVVSTAIVGALLFPGLAERGWKKVVRYADRVDVELNLSRLSSGPTVYLSQCTAKDGLNSPAFWIAHGGGVGKYVYTNCLEAVQDSLAKGFRYIELDLLETTDGHLVGAHDWARLRELVGASRSNAPMSREEIMGLQAGWKYTPLFAEDICRLMQENPDMVLVTDKTQDFELLVQEIPYVDRMVVEAFTCKDYLNALRVGLQHVALSVCSMGQLQKIEEFGLSGAVLYAPFLEKSSQAQELVARLHARGCCITVFHSAVADTPDFIHQYLGRSISRTYLYGYMGAEECSASL